MRWKYGVDDLQNLRWRRGASSSWRALTTGTEVIRKGLRWSIGDGQSINVWKDSWLFENSLAKSPTMINVEADISMLKVCDLWQGREWDVSVVQNLFGEDMAKLILQLAIPVTTLPDQLLWRGRPLIEFSTKVAYESITLKPESSNTLGTSWGWIWKLGASERVKMFIWKVGHCCIPTKAFLHHRRVVTELRCPRCNDYAEDLFHLVLDCRFSIEVWNSITNLFELDLVPTDLWTWWQWCARGGKELESSLEKAKHRSIIVYTVWELWRQRNRACFDDEILSSKEVVDMAMKQWTEWWGQLDVNPFERASFLRRNEGVVVKWVLPTEGWLKINFDGSLSNNGEAAASYVIRNHEGRLLSAGGSYLQGYTDINEAELRGAWEGIVKAITSQLGEGRIWVEGDSEFVIGLLSGTHRRSFNLSHDARRMLNGLQEVKITHIYREGNGPANWVANYCRLCSANVHWNSNFPFELVRLVEADASGVSFVRE